jgi:hypothetical protein
MVPAVVEVLGRRLAVLVLCFMRWVGIVIYAAEKLLTLSWQEKYSPI